MYKYDETIPSDKKYYCRDDIRPNDYAFKCIRTIIFVLGGIILTYLTLYALKQTHLYFFPDINPTLYALLGSFGLLLIGYTFGIKMDHSDKRLKYIIVFLCVLAVTLIQTFMTYIVVLTTFAPLLIAAQYSDKKCTMFAYILTMISSIVIVYLSYQYGLCDANMVLFPMHKVAKYNSVLTIPIKPLSEVWLSLFILFILPRFILISSFTPLINSIVENRKEIIAEETQSHDGLTGFYNRSKYNIMVKLKYVDFQDVAIIFFDINNLKQTNDHLGHERGDKLILMAARSIKLAESPRVDSYRLGGDEFMVVIEDGTQDDIDQFISCWKTNLEAINNNSDDIKCYIAYGSAHGKGENFSQLLSEADSNMYANKKKIKDELDFLKSDATETTNKWALK